MNETIFTYRDEISCIYRKLMDYIKGRKEVHYEIVPGAYAPNPYIYIVTKDIDYIDGTRLEAFESIVKTNCKQSIFTWGVETCKIIVETKMGHKIYAFGLKIQFNFYERKEEENR